MNTDRRFDSDQEPTERAPGRPAEPFPDPKQPRIPDHELLRVIGRGGYGEVWLARNVMGTYRAVKVIFRRTFEHARPYEREFEGIKRYEPVSRTHPSQVTILHVGRHERDEYFYYVMELADDATAEPLAPRPVSKRTSSEGKHLAPEIQNPASYLPRTLQSELKKRGKLPLDECVTLGLALATALEHLHEHGLIHRDVKPGNVVFVHGLPKLADIGLVAEMDTSMSYVGTRGYFPPEGPGTAQADLYSLGKVLYEISTGKDRNEFPELPRELDDLTEEARFLEFNEILLKACHGDPGRRYTSAPELLADLALLREGRSIRQKRGRERLLAGLTRTTVWAALVLLVGTVGYLARRPAQPENALPRRLHVDNPVFWRIEQFPRLFDFAPDGERIVFGSRNLSLWDRETSINRPLTLRGFEGWRVPEQAVPRWAPNGREFMFLAGKGAHPTNPPLAWALFLADAETGDTRQIGSELGPDEKVREFCWLPDGKAITLVTERSSAGPRFYTQALTGGRSLWVESNLPDEDRVPSLGGYSPDGTWLVISAPTGSKDHHSDQHLWLIPHLGGRALPLVQRPGINTHPSWGPDGRTIYFASSGGRRLGRTVGVWKVRLDPKTGLATEPPQEVLIKRGQTILHPALVANGQRLAYAVKEPDTRIFMGDTRYPETARAIIRGQSPVLSPDGGTVYFVGETQEQQGVYAIDSREAKSVRKITGRIPLPDGFIGNRMSLSPDGQLLAMPSLDGARLGIFIVPTSGEPTHLVAVLPGGESILPVWSPDSQWLAYTADKLLYKVSRDGQTRERLATLYRWQGWSLRWSPDGAALAALGYASPEDGEQKLGVYVITVADKSLRQINPESSHTIQYKEGLEWHPDGQSLTWMQYGPDEYGAVIKRAYLADGRVEDMIDQPDHWDYVGTWSPDGNLFFFLSTSCHPGRGQVHVFHAETKAITHALRDGSLPEWSRDGRTSAWAAGRSVQHFEVVEGVK